MARFEDLTNEEIVELSALGKIVGENLDRFPAVGQFGRIRDNLDLLMFLRLARSLEAHRKATRLQTWWLIALTAVLVVLTFVGLAPLLHKP